MENKIEVVLNKVEVLQDLTKIMSKDNPFDKSLDYSFPNCIKNKLAKKIGCQNIWKKFLESKLPVCTTMSQLFMNIQENDKFKHQEQTELVEYMDCPFHVCTRSMNWWRLQ